MITTYPFLGQWQDDMGEISGFGGSYEQDCRAMLRAGVLWLVDRGEDLPSPTLFLRLLEDDEIARDLTRIIDEAAIIGGSTGLMHCAVMGDVMFIVQNGWEAYVDLKRMGQQSRSQERALS